MRRIRELEAEIVAARRAAGDEHLHLLAGPELFGLDDVDDLPDGLHPNAAGYRRMGERFHTWRSRMDRSAPERLDAQPFGRMDSRSMTVPSGTIWSRTMVKRRRAIFQPSLVGTSSSS